VTFYGDHVMIQKGYVHLLKRMADDLEIRYNHEVQKVIRKDGSIKIVTNMGREFEADCCVCTLPLAVLQKDNVEFIPSLPLEKRTALKQLGAGNLNKTVLIFEEKFWGDEDYFGFCHQPECKKDTDESSMFVENAVRGR